MRNTLKNHPVLIICTAALFAGCSGGDEGADTVKTVKVERRTITEKALAVGTLEPTNEISVKSKVSGVVKKIFIETGDYVEAGSPLIEIKPDPTPLELAEAKRNVEMSRIAFENSQQQIKRNKELVGKKLVSQKEYEDALRDYRENELKVRMAQEKLELIEKGRVSIAGAKIESIIKAPISGYVLDKEIDIGDPVVPLSSYQAGTVLMTMADMSNLIFKGDVDEIDVGKLREGMEVSIDVGAIPGEEDVVGALKKISLKANKEDNTTVFPIEVELASKNGAVLRAGYSANANIIVQKRENVLSIPERVISFRNDSAFVRVHQNEESSKEQYIQTGLSNAIHIEVIAGLDEGDTIQEKPVKKIE